jgi:hypothetical protein
MGWNGRWGDQGRLGNRRDSEDLAVAVPLLLLLWVISGRTSTMVLAS